MNQKIQDQKLSLQMALSSLNTIEQCDEEIKNGNFYFKGVRENAVTEYGNALADIIECGIIIGVEFERRASISEDLLETINTITNQYRESHGINTGI